jgi:hypothetical protein
VTGRDRTCDAPRFRRALYRLELRSRVEAGWNQALRKAFSSRAVVERARELLRLSYSPSSEWTGRESNPRTTAPICRVYHRGAVALPSSQLSGPWIRDKGSNLDLHVQSVVSCRLDDPGTCGQKPPLRPSPERPGRSTQQASAARRATARRSLSRPAEAGRCFPCHSPTLRPWIAGR